MGFPSFLIAPIDLIRNSGVEFIIALLMTLYIPSVASGPVPDLPTTFQELYVYVAVPEDDFLEKTCL